MLKATSAISASTAEVKAASPITISKWLGRLPHTTALGHGSLSRQARAALAASTLSQCPRTTTRRARPRALPQQRMTALAGM